MLSDRAKAPRPVIQAALEEGGIDAICDFIAKLAAVVVPLVASRECGADLSGQPATGEEIRQVIPCERTAEIGRKLFDHRPSAGKFVQAVACCAPHLAPAVAEIRDLLVHLPVLHSDETGIRCNAHHLLRELKACADGNLLLGDELILALPAVKQAADRARERGADFLVTPLASNCNMVTTNGSAQV